MSWVRLGIHPTISRWLPYMDVGGPTVIRIPWALAIWKRYHYDGFRPTPSLEHPASFVRTRGTPQGDVSSLHNWVSFFDIALRALNFDQQNHAGASLFAFKATGRRRELYNAGDISFADDLVSTTGTLPELQRIADILSAFPVLFDMELSQPSCGLQCSAPVLRTRALPPGW